MQKKHSRKLNNHSLIKLDKLGIEENLLNLITYIYKKSKVKIFTNIERLITSFPN